MPRCLIGLCASYLKQSSYVALSACNRSTFLGCNAPSMLQQVSVYYRSPSDHQMLDFSAFQFVNKLTLRALLIEEVIDSFFSFDRMELMAAQISKMSRLRSLDLRAMDFTFTELVATHKATIQRTKSLSVSVTNHIEYWQFLTSVPEFQHIQFLKVGFDNRMILATEEEIKLLLGICSNLKGLDFYDHGCEIELRLVEAIGHRLHFLTLNDYAGIREIEYHPGRSVPILKAIDFINLRELRDETSYIDSWRAILSTAVNLEKICVFPKHDYGAGFIEEILTKCERLRCLQMEVGNEIELVLDALERGLLRTKKHKRDILKIRIISETNMVNNKFIAQLARIVDALSMYPADQWMLILHLNECRRITRNSFVKELRASLTAETLVVQNNDQHSAKYVMLIRNPGCTIIGWRESWICEFNTPP